MTGLLAVAAALAVTAAAPPKSPIPAAAANTAPRCFVRVNQPAASLRLNRAEIPKSICFKSCEAVLVGAHREQGQVVALAIYTGKHCR